MGNTQVESGRLEFISYLRVFSMACILLCHYVQEIPNGLIQSTSQIFNIGVPLFFIISGFCFGLQGKIENPGNWYLKRLKRIYIPYWIFLLMYLCVFIVLGKKIDLLSWCMYALGLQGNYFKIAGIEHTWFITPLIVCYLITPLISAFTERFMKSKVYVKALIIFAAAVFYLIVCFNPYENLFVIASPVVFYIAAYIWGRNYSRIPPAPKTAAISAVIIAAAFGIRFASHFVLDETMLYNRFICGFTHYAAAFGVFRLFEYIFRNSGKNKYVAMIDSVSFEIYLCHYIFLKGAIVLTRLTANIFINLLIITVITFAVAYVIHLLNSLVQKKIKQ